MPRLAQSLRALTIPYLARVAALGLVLSFACHLNATFDIIESGEAQLAGASTPATLNFPALTDFDLAQHPSLKQQGLTLDEIQTVVLEDATLAISSPATGGNISFLSSIDLVAQAPGLPDIIVATASAPLAATNSVLLIPEDKTDVLTYAKSSGFALVAEVTYAQPPPVTMTLTLSASLRLVIAEPAGTCKHQ